jgi:hypothetical protein
MSEGLRKFTNLPRADLPASKGSAFAVFNRVRSKLRQNYLNQIGRKYWQSHGLVSSEEFYHAIHEAVGQKTPLAVGRLGGVEASIVMWAKGIPSCPWRPDFWTLFADTAYGATNAGIRPRNRKSYRTFAELAWEALENLDLHGVWSAGYEAACLQLLSPREFFNVEITGPDGANPNHWLCTLQGKRVLVVSPFDVTIQKQIPRLAEVWPQSAWMSGTEFCSVPFPYLIDEGCPETWWEVYNRIGAIVSRGDYDVALFGCGGLGLPFAHLAKKAGRVGIHLGGHLQLIFGIYGQRHLEQEWHRKHINEAWVRPDAGEVAKTASRVEGGCYW